MDILELNGLSVETLEALSYHSELNLSLKNTLHHFDKDRLIEELLKMRRWLNETDLLDEVDLDYRIKSAESIVGKYERYIGTSRQTR